jgi:hypothetical protein
VESGDIIQESRAALSRYTRAASSESARLKPKLPPDPNARHQKLGDTSVTQLERFEMKCPRCNAEISSALRFCTECSSDIGFPNVRAAQSNLEIDALNVRHAGAYQSAEVRGSRSQLENFGLAVVGSHAVLARNLSVLDSFVKKDNELYISYHKQVRGGYRIPENNKFDAGRVAVESTIHPHYFEDINFSALSLDGIGVTAFGLYSITLREKLIAHRTTVFEENPFIFCQRFHLVAGDAAPPGYRAIWAHRDKLAIAKLHSRIDKTTTPAQYASILLRQGTTTNDGDFMEAHIYGPLHRSSIERVIGPKPRTRLELTIWKSVSRVLRDSGASVEEV